MARYFKQDIQGESDPSTPPYDPLGGLQSMRRDRWEAPMRAQDTVATVGRRVILEASAGAASGWRFNSGGPSSSDTAEVAYAVGRSRLTSGNFLRASVLFLPSGGVGQTATPTEAFGRLRLRITWTAEDATTETHDVDIELVASTNEDYDELTGAGAAFGELRELSTTITPPVDLTDDAEANRWTVSPTVDVEVYMVGAPRVVDFCLHETPHQVVMESDDASWASHIFATEAIDAESQAASQRPRLRRNETSPDGNPRGGTQQTLSVAREQRSRFGPALLSWGHYQEATSSATAGLVALQRAGSAANLVGLFDASQTAYDPDREGLSVSCGGYARGYRDTNGHLLGTEDTEAAIPVVFRLFGTATASCRVRLMTADHSWVEVTVGPGTNDWYEGWGWLKVGLSPSDVRVAQVFVDGNATVSVLAFSVERLA